ncbi:MAG: ATP-binding cassette domain-containing protein [Pseudomonadota bacterium]
MQVVLPVLAGRWTVLLGPSGVGKSTLLRLIAGLPSGGQLDGAITADDAAPAAGRVAWMGQTDLLAPWLDVMGNVTLGARLRGERPDLGRARALIGRVGLAGREHDTPVMLSGGQRQRVALARTLMEDRPIVLLDEPFSALDARTRAEMQELAHEVLAGRTVILVTHEPGEAARLGDALWLMLEAGLQRMSTPPGAPVRDLADTALLAAQAELWQALRAPAPPSSPAPPPLVHAARPAASPGGPTRP